MLLNFPKDATLTTKTTTTIVRYKRLGIVLIDLAALLFLVRARFLVVGPAMYNLVVAGVEIRCLTTYSLIAGAILMTIFNVLCFIDNILKLYDSAVDVCLSVAHQKDS